MKAGVVASEIRDADAFVALETEWWDLWRRAQSATPFQSPAWLIPWWQCFHPGELFTVTIRHNGQLVGLAPFYIEKSALARRILPVGISVSDYLDVLFDPAYAAEAGHALVESIAHEAGGWDEWSLEELEPDAAALSLPAPARCQDSSMPQSACPVLALAARAASVWDFVPARKRRDTNLARNRAARRGEIVIESADPARTSEMLELLFRLHAARWQSRGTAGVLESEMVRSFQHAAAPRLAAAGLLRLWVLHIGSQPAAVHYGLMHGRRAFAYLTGFDPGFAFESPGVILLAHAIEQAFAEGASEFHFLRGAESYKYQWGAVDRWNVRRSFRHEASLDA
jgi:CelD/BcsL family acetyltransferase involved in cellulose biosynthesis